MVGYHSLINKPPSLILTIVYDLILLGVGLLLIVILLVGLNRLFKRYSQQVQLILETTRENPLRWQFKRTN